MSDNDQDFIELKEDVSESPLRNKDLASTTIEMKTVNSQTNKEIGNS